MPDTPTALTIREATGDDASLVLSLIRDLAEYERLAHQVVATESLIRKALTAERRVVEAIIAEVGGTAVGFALFFHNFSTFLGRPGIYLEDLFVRPEHRGKGYGKRLLAHLARLAITRECGRLEWAVLDWNEDAIRFYRRLGAEPQDEWTVYRVAGEALASLATDS